MIYRPYQADCLQAIQTGFEEGHRKQLAFLPTGAGKTVIFLAEAKRRIDAGQNVLIIAHRDDLVRQPAEKAKGMGLEAHVEKANEYAPDDARLVVASVQSLWGKKPRLTGRKWDLVITDEAHHSVSPQWRQYLDSIDDLETDFLGVTATPHRHDEKSLSEWWSQVAYQITLAQLVHQGYLAPITVECLPVNITVPKFGKEISAEAADAIIQPVLEELARLVVRATMDRKRIVVFLPLIRTSQRFAAMLTAAGCPAAHVDGTMADRKAIEARFRAGEFRALCNSMVLTEGWDEPCVDCIIPLRPIVSSSLYQQIVGRGTRLFPGKEDMLLLDLLWQTKRHIARPSSLIGGDPELAFSVTAKTLSTRKSLVELAKEANALEVSRTASLLRKAEREQKRKAFRISYIAFCARNNVAPGETNAPMELRASEKQMAFLRKFKVDVPEGLSRASASTLIGRLMHRNPYRRK